MVYDPVNPHAAAKNLSIRAQQRLQILSWNCSGLTEFEELKLYLRRHPEIQVISLQETHRAFQNE